MRSLRLFVYPMVLALGLMVPAAAAQTRVPLPIAYISIQRVLAEADAAKAAAKELESLRNAKTQDIAAKKQALDATRLQIANAGGYFSASKRARLQEVARRQEFELQQATQQAQLDLQESQRKAQERIRAELSAAVTSIANQRGYLYVLNQDAALVWAPTGANLTDEVLAKLNAAVTPREANATPVAPAP